MRVALTCPEDLYQALHIPRLAAALQASPEAAAEVQCSLVCQLQDNQLWKLSQAMQAAGLPSMASPGSSGTLHAGGTMPPSAEEDFEKLLRLLMPLGDSETAHAFFSSAPPADAPQAAEDPLPDTLGDMGMFDSEGEGTADARPEPPEPGGAATLDFSKSLQADARLILAVLLHCNMMRPQAAATCSTWGCSG